ncbi:alanine racemase [Nocardioides sp. Root1257]|uniref:alanine racemase n=1 Tax=unclassified Nocardioides TaxID=2615069 RepID=UPI0006F92349|nr:MULTISPECIES: alanine racemase [unclassified Nocardioides]KQW48810.1 alanine racemase [Nocardioides sp. Root1257]KRC47985.1 alanine racemase [Nocardioides sp. Root224]
MSPLPVARAEIVVDLAAIRHNVRTLRELTGVQMMTVVKADGYGHGMVEVARAARGAGSEWIGVATIDEALALREAGDTGRLLCWLTVPGEDHAAAIAADVDLTAYSVAELHEIEDAAGQVGRPARLQLKVDTGLSRGGAPMDTWSDVVAAAAAGERDGTLAVTGVWSHLAASDEPDHPANDAQEAVFREALDIAAAAGLRPEVRHLANSAGAILRPSARFDLVRVGLASYGLDPAPGHTPDLGLRPAMTVRATLAQTKPLAAGASVSYGHTWTAETPTTVGLVPVGYADGVPRHASNVAQVLVDGKRRAIRGRVCMDQFVVDLDGDLPSAGRDVVLFGPGTDGEPTAQDWAEASGTISYEIVTRVGGRMSRRYVDK